MAKTQTPEIQRRREAPFGKAQPQGRRPPKREPQQQRQRLQQPTDPTRGGETRGRGYLHIRRGKSLSGSGPAVRTGQVRLGVGGTAARKVLRGHRGGCSRSGCVGCVGRAPESARGDAKAGQRVLVAKRSQWVGQGQGRRQGGQATPTSTVVASAVATLRRRLSSA